MATRRGRRLAGAFLGASVGLGSRALLGLFESVAVAGDVDDLSAVEMAIDESEGAGGMWVRIPLHSISRSGRKGRRITKTLNGLPTQDRLKFLYAVIFLLLRCWLAS
jgi:hypothetical protein